MTPQALQERLPNLNDPADQQLAILALCVYREARGEPLNGKIAVAKVICNRATDARKRWPSDPVKVILAPKQFSSFSSDDPNVNVFPKTADESAWKDCIAAAACGLAKDRPDPSLGANHYFAHAGGFWPKWAKDMTKKTAVIGRHTFFKLCLAAALCPTFTAAIGGLSFYRI